MVPSEPISTFEERVAQRQSWPATKTAGRDGGLAEGPADATAAWQAVLELTAESYRVAGHDLVALPRAQWPARVFRRGERRPDSHGIY